MSSAEPKSGIVVNVDADDFRPKVTAMYINDIPHAAVPNDMELENLERLLSAPTRIKSDRQMEEPDSFCAYVEHFKSAQTRIFGAPDKYLFSAILDDHLPNEPHWGDHRVGLQLTLSPEWKEWIEACAKPLGQQGLAEFFEEHIEQIAAPDAGDLLSDIRNIHISNNTKCESVQREGGDIAFTLATETLAGTKTERGKIPSRLELVIAPFRSWHPVQMSVMLGYRLSKDNGLGFTMRVLYAEQLLNKSFNDIRNHLQDKLGLPILI